MFLFENLLLSHKFWPRGLKLVLNIIMYTPNLQMTVQGC